MFYHTQSNTIADQIKYKTNLNKIQLLYIKIHAKMLCIWQLTVAPKSTKNF